MVNATFTEENMMKRKAVAMLLALTVMSTMVACGGKKEEQTSANIESR